MNKIPTEAETPPQNLTTKQTMNMVRAMLKETLSMDVSVSCAEDEVIHIGTQFRLWNEGNYWQCSANRDDGNWAPCYPMGADNPLEYFSRIIQCMARKKLDVWLMTNYDCMA